MKLIKLLLCRALLRDFKEHMPEKDDYNLYESSATLFLNGSMKVAIRHTRGRRNAYLQARWMGLKLGWRFGLYFTDWSTKRVRYRDWRMDWNLRDCQCDQCGEGPVSLVELSINPEDTELPDSMRGKNWRYVGHFCEHCHRRHLGTYYEVPTLQ